MPNAYNNNDLLTDTKNSNREQQSNFKLWLMVEYLKASIKLRLSTQNINKILKIEFNPTGPRLTSHIMLNMLTHSFRVHFERAHIVC